MAEEKAAAKAPADSGHSSGGSSGGKPIILYALVILNMIVVAGVGAMIFMKSKIDAQHATTIEKAVNPDAADHGHADAHGDGHGGKGDGGHGKEDEDVLIGKMIPMETFLVNLSGNRGSKLLKVNMEFEVEGDRIADEIDKRKPQIRDIIIILLSSKTYAQMSAQEGKEFLRDEIKDTVNSFLTKGKIKRVHFTEFVFN